jgi:hypothetical protein
MSALQPMTSDRADLAGGRSDANDEGGIGMVVLISTAVLVVVAVALGVVAVLVHVNASDTQTKAERIERAAKQQAANTANASGDLVTLQGAADHAYSALGTLVAAYQAQLASQNHAIDVANAAAASYNAGQGTIADALKAEAQAAVTDAETRTAAVKTALVEVKQAFLGLQQAAG